MGRPNRGNGTAGPKRPGGTNNGGGREQYSIGGTTKNSCKKNRRWVATMIGNGNPIDWYEII